jgi:hypothetical protein
MRFARSSSIHLFTRFVCILEKLGSLQASGLFGPASFSAASDEGEGLEQKSSTVGDTCGRFTALLLASSHTLPTPLVWHP